MSGTGGDVRLFSVEGREFRVDWADVARFPRSVLASQAFAETGREPQPAQLPGRSAQFFGLVAELLAAGAQHGPDSPGSAAAGREPFRGGAVLEGGRVLRHLRARGGHGVPRPREAAAGVPPPGPRGAAGLRGLALEGPAPAVGLPLGCPAPAERQVVFPRGGRRRHQRAPREPGGAAGGRGAHGAAPPRPRGAPRGGRRASPPAGGDCALDPRWGQMFRARRPEAASACDLPWWSCPLATQHLLLAAGPPRGAPGAPAPLSAADVAALGQASDEGAAFTGYRCVFMEPLPEGAADGVHPDELRAAAVSFVAAGPAGRPSAQHGQRRAVLAEGPWRFAAVEELFEAPFACAEVSVSIATAAGSCGDQAPRLPPLRVDVSATGEGAWRTAWCQAMPPRDDVLSQGRSFARCFLPHAVPELRPPPLPAAWAPRGAAKPGPRGGDLLRELEAAAGAQPAAELLAALGRAHLEWALGPAALADPRGAVLVGSPPLLAQWPKGTSSSTRPRSGSPCTSCPAGCTRRPRSTG
ncbi:unnamed protein product [Prorocentrum cordatum]|uniref:Uncharacterized protein n=1 Tax=Prorocentrum cordatum TaxID=2364126 RepID=A0ABN9VBG1_9DINO|nr:unnamed protein product [Polarella glacialis]